jgi:hypothetical protein
MILETGSASPMETLEIEMKKLHDRISGNECVCMKTNFSINWQKERKCMLVQRGVKANN